MTTKRRRESRACTGRSFSMLGTAGYMAAVMDFATRPHSHGSTALTTPDYTASNFYCATHGLVTGQAVILTGTAAPTGLTLTTNITFPLQWGAITEYWVIRIDADNFKLATSHYLAKIGTASAFSSNGTAVSVTPLGGGAGWTLWDDYSRQVPQTCAYTAVNTTANTLTLVAHGFSHMQRVTIASSATLPSPLVAGTAYWIVRVDADTIKLASTEALAFANTGIDITTQGSGNHTITTSEHFVIITDTAGALVNDYNTSPAGMAPKFLKLGYQATESGYVRMQGIAWWDVTTHTPWGYWSGKFLATYDSAIFSYQLIGGDEYFFQSTQLGSSWYRVYIDTFTAITSKLEAISKVGILQSGITAGSDVVVQLDTGEAANFTVNKFYYIYDFNGRAQVEYVKVTARDVVLDTITIDSCELNFLAGSVVTAYAHRYYMGGDYINTFSDTNMSYRNSYTAVGTYFCIPYYSNTIQARVFHPQNRSIISAATYDEAIELVNVGIPDDELNFDCVRHKVAEAWPNYDSLETAQNRLYGKANNVVVAGAGTLGLMTNYRTLLGVDYLYCYATYVNAAYVYQITYSESDV